MESDLFQFIFIWWGFFAIVVTITIYKIVGNRVYNPWNLVIVGIGLISPVLAAALFIALGGELLYKGSRRLNFG